MSPETLQSLTPETLAIQICQDSAFQAALTTVIKTYLNDGSPSHPTLESMRQASADYDAGRIQATPWREVFGETHALES